MHSIVHDGLQSVLSLLESNECTTEDVNLVGPWGWTPLHFAAQRGDVGIVMALLKKGANIRARTDDDRYPLSMAIKAKHYECMEALLKWTSHAIMDEMLFACVEDDNLPALQLLIKYDTSTSPYEDDLLIQASQNGNLDMVRLLMERGVRARNLHYALGSNGACITELLNAGTNPHAADKFGVTAVHIAAAFGIVESLKALLAFDPTVLKKRTVEGFSALELAVLGRKVECVQLIMQCKALNGTDWMVDVSDTHGGFNALCLACAIPEPCAEIVAALCREMEFDSHLSWTLQTPLHLARHSPSVSQVLRNHGARICKHGLGGCCNTIMSSKYAVQQWWHCKTCGFTGNMGVCVYCLDKCHQGHETEGPFFSRFFCDCTHG